MGLPILIRLKLENVDLGSELNRSQRPSLAWKTTRGNLARRRLDSMAVLISKTKAPSTTCYWSSMSSLLRTKSRSGSEDENKSKDWFLTSAYYLRIFSPEAHPNELIISSFSPQPRNWSGKAESNATLIEATPKQVWHYSHSIQTNTQSSPRENIQYKHDIDTS